MGMKRIRIDVLRHKVVTSTTTTTRVDMHDRLQAGPGVLPIKYQRVKFISHLIPEVQVLVDDGTILEHWINGSWLIGDQPTAHFIFEDKDKAMLFKLMWA